jgi:hypothetical protein
MLPLIHHQIPQRLFRSGWQFPWQSTEKLFQFLSFPVMLVDFVFDHLAGWRPRTTILRFRVAIVFRIATVSLFKRFYLAFETLESGFFFHHFTFLK